MSIQYFKILNNYNLTNFDTLDKNIEGLDESALRSLHREIEQYYSGNLPTIIQELQSGEGFNIGPSYRSFPISTNEQFLRSACLYCDKLVIWDNIQTSLSGLTHGMPLKLIKWQLSDQIRQLLNMKDLAYYGVLTLIPTTLYSSEQWKQIGRISQMDTDNTKFREICLSNIDIWMDDVSTYDGQSCGMRKVILGRDSPSYFGVYYTAVPPQCSVDIKPGPPFMLHTPKGSFEFKLKNVPLESMDNDDFLRQQVDQIINTTANHLNVDLISSEYLNSTYFTNFNVHWQLLNWKFENPQEKLRSQDKISNVFSVELLRDLRFLDELPINVILEIREKLGDDLIDLRMSLKDLYREIESLPYTKDFEVEIERLRNKNIEPKLEILDKGLNSIRSDTLLGAFSRAGTIALASVTALVATGEPLWLVGLSGIAPQLLDQYRQYSRECNRLKENSLYSLWKVKRLSNR